MHRGIGRRPTVARAASFVGALLSIWVMAAVDAPSAHAVPGELIVDSPLANGWAPATPADIAIAYQPDDDSTGLTLDITIDGASVHHSSCECTEIGTPLQSYPFITPDPKVTYDPAPLAEGSTHTLDVTVTRAPSGEQVSQSWTFKVDKTAPTQVGPGGELVDRAGGYVDAAHAHGLTLGGYDATSGVSTVSWQTLGESMNHSGLLTNNCFNAPVCDPDLSSGMSVSTSTLGSGAHQLRTEAYDRAGNVSYSAPWTIYVDDAGPAAPTGFVAQRDPETGQAYLDWSDGGDPSLADNSPGSGTAQYSYRYRIGGGAWTAVVAGDENDVELGAVASGTAISVEVTPIDAVGNAGTPATGSVTVTDATDGVEEDTDALDDDGNPIDDGEQSRSAEDEEAGPIEKVVKCKSDVYIAALINGDDESNVYIRGRLRATCQPKNKLNPKHVAADDATVYHAVVCVQVLEPSYPEADQDGYRTLECEGKTKYHPTPDTPLDFQVRSICLPGQRYYRTRMTNLIAGPYIPSRKRFVTPARLRGCNGAGAWRLTAKRSTERTPNQILAANLRNGPPDPLPAGDFDLGGQRGWEAHHIVPAGEGRGIEGTIPGTSGLGVEASRAQRYAYDCGIQPNGSANGVWLRGNDLVPANPSSWAKVSAADPNDRARALHRLSGVGVHSFSEGYYRYVANLLSGYVDDATDECSSPSNAAGAVAAVRGLLKQGTIPTTP